MFLKIFKKDAAKCLNISKYLKKIHLNIYKEKLQELHPVVSSAQKSASGSIEL